MTFQPNYRFTNKLVSVLMRIEAARQLVDVLPITPQVLASLRETARLYSTHYSTMIEGNRLTQIQVQQLISDHEHFPGRERDEKEVLGYYAAMEQMEAYATKSNAISEMQIQKLHALVMAGGKIRVKASTYRDGQNVIRDSTPRGIVYMPPEAKDVVPLMADLVYWINSNSDLPCPIRASIAHYQFATIHPYYDGNGRTARLLTTLILHLGGYGLKGIYSLEEYYATNLPAYYEALTIGPSHNYYLGRVEADITKFIEYFCIGMADSFERVTQHAQTAAKSTSRDHSQALRSLDPRKRKLLPLFKKTATITSRDVMKLFSVSDRTARHILSSWLEDGFLRLHNPSNRARSYALHDRYSHLV